MYCKNCGSQIGDQATFCPNCGTPTQNTSNLSTNTPSPPTIPQYAQPIPNQNMYATPVPTSKWNLPWLPMVLAVVTFVLSAYLGGDVDSNEVNAFDWIAALLGVISFVSVFFTIPSNRKKLKIVSIVITAFMALGLIGYLIL